MPASRCSCFPLFVLVAFLLAASLPSAAQVHGVPPSVTSFGFGGSDNPTPGIRASVTSLGPNGYGSAFPFLGNCCANFFWQPDFWQSGVLPPLQSERHRHHRDDTTIIPLVTPVYVPYAVPYGGDSDDDTAEDAPDTYASGSGTAGRDDPKRLGHREVADEPGPSDAAPEESAIAQPEDVPAQPSTILVFKDGHRSEVVNYAIIGSTLFDFAGGRTHKILLADLDLPATQKANDEQGVEFKLPPTSQANSAPK